MVRDDRRARLGDVRDLALGMPFTKEERGTQGKPVYQVGGKSFIFFRNPRPDAVDDKGEQLSDVIVFWVQSEADRQSLLQDDTLPFFTTSHFEAHPSVLLRAADVDNLSLAQLTEVVQDAWLARASRKRSRQWLNAQGLDP